MKPTNIVRVVQLAERCGVMPMVMPTDFIHIHFIDDGILFRLLLVIGMWFRKIFHFLLQWQSCQHIRGITAKLDIDLIALLVKHWILKPVVHVRTLVYQLFQALLVSPN